MKRIGLVGGMTPESTGISYRLLIQGASRPGGGLPIQVLDTTEIHVAAILAAAS